MFVFLFAAFSCPDNLAAPENGKILYSEPNSMGFVSTITYSCDDGFLLFGSDTNRTCMGVAGTSSGKWSGTPPTCERMCACVHVRIVVKF